MGNPIRLGVNKHFLFIYARTCTQDWCLFIAQQRCEQTHAHPPQARLKDTKHTSYRISVFKAKREREEDKDHHIMKAQINNKEFCSQRKE